MFRGAACGAAVLAAAPCDCLVHPLWHARRLALLVAGRVGVSVRVELLSPSPTPNPVELFCRAAVLIIKPAYDVTRDDCTVSG